MKALKWLAAGLCVLLTPALASAQNFPDHTIRLIVPFPPGGPNDIIARVVSQKMQAILKQTIVIDNRGGQGGVLGTDLVAKAKPDGYTIAIASAGALAISPSMEKVAYDTLKDLAPVTLVAKVPEMLVVAENVPAKNMAELVALAKKQPGKLNFASSGPGSLPHLAGELFKLTAKIDIVHVPYRGAAPAVNDLLGGQVQMVFLDLPVLLPQVKAGKLRPIAVGAEKRMGVRPALRTASTLPGAASAIAASLVAIASSIALVMIRLCTSCACRPGSMSGQVSSTVLEIGPTRGTSQSSGSVVSPARRASSMSWAS